MNIVLKKIRDLLSVGSVYGFFFVIYFNCVHVLVPKLYICICWVNVIFVYICIFDLRFGGLVGYLRRWQPNVEFFLMPVMMHKLCQH